MTHHLILLSWCRKMLCNLLIWVNAFLLAAVSAVFQPHQHIQTRNDFLFIHVVWNMVQLFNNACFWIAHKSTAFLSSDYTRIFPHLQSFYDANLVNYFHKPMRSLLNATISHIMLSSESHPLSSENIDWISESILLFWLSFSAFRLFERSWVKSITVS